MSQSAEVDVWSIDIAAAAGRERQLGALLDDAERDRADRFAWPVDALRYRVAHGALRTILGARTGIAPRQIRFSHGEHGKPLVLDGGPRFSLSHSGALALVAVSAERDVGVDVEEVRAIADAPALARRFFSPEQARWIAEQPPAERDLRFLRTWTAMEAILKADGTGLADALDGFEVRDSGDGAGARAAIAGAPGCAAWSVRWLVLAPLHVGAVAALGADLAVRMRRFA